MVKYRTVDVEGIDVFYREAGDPANPTLLLLHGFPTSSHMFRNLIDEIRAGVAADRSVLAVLRPAEKGGMG